MKTTFHKAETRGHADHGWLNTHHSFSFANYYDPERMHFGVLRVLNDDVVQAGKGFGTHPHQNMEIVTIPLSGALAHKDSTGRQKTIHSGEVQIMSAGTGIEHSEFNASEQDPVNLLQIWIIPGQMDIEPRYDQKEFAQPQNEWVNVVAPDTQSSAVFINQQCWFSLGNFEAGTFADYSLHNSEHGVYIFVIEGKAEVAGHSLEKRDGLGLWELEKPEISLQFSKDTKLLLMEMTMQLPKIS